MGKLAKWGALAGAGKGISENSQNKRQERLFNLEQSRRETLERWRAQQQDARQTRTQEHQINLETRREEFRSNEAKSERDWRSREKSMDRELDVLLQGMENAGRTNTFGSKMREWLAKGSDIDQMSKQDPAGLATVNITQHKPSGATYRDWSATTGTLSFPEDRDPLTLSERFGVNMEELSSDEEDETRSRIIDAVLPLEKTLIRSIGTDENESVEQMFQSEFGYLPLQYRRIKYAQDVLGNGN